METKTEYQMQAQPAPVSLPPGAAQYTASPAPQQQLGQPPMATYQTIITPLQSVNRDSVVVECPKCHQKQPTRLEYKIGNMTHLFAVWLGLGILCLASWVPYTISAAKDVDHHCGNCGVLLATKHRSGGVVVHPVA